jgi:hypothetical protein
MAPLLPGSYWMNRRQKGEALVPCRPGYRVNSRQKGEALVPNHGQLLVGRGEVPATGREIRRVEVEALGLGHHHAA